MPAPERSFLDSVVRPLATTAVDKVVDTVFNLVEEVWPVEDNKPSPEPTPSELSILVKAFADRARDAATYPDVYSAQSSSSLDAFTAALTRYEAGDATAHDIVHAFLAINTQTQSSSATTPPPAPAPPPLAPPVRSTYEKNRFIRALRLTNIRLNYVTLDEIQHMLDAHTSYTYDTAPDPDVKIYADALQELINRSPSINAKAFCCRDMPRTDITFT